MSKRTVAESGARSEYGSLPAHVRGAGLEPATRCLEAIQEQTTCSPCVRARFGGAERAGSEPSAAEHVRPGPFTSSKGSGRGLSVSW